MTMHLHSADGGRKTGEDALAHALTAADPTTRIMARGAAAGWSEDSVRWINDEFSRPKANPVDVLMAFASLQMQILGSVAAQCMPADADAMFAQHMATIFGEGLAPHMAKTRAGIAGARS